MRICCDLDGTICNMKLSHMTYNDVIPMEGAVESLRRWRQEGHYIILQTARHMKTYDSNEGKVLANLGYLYEWLSKWNIEYDELYIGKPYADVYIDDCAITHNSWSDTAHTIDTMNRGW
jgi:capsule biosynthesis phosphatase